MSPKVTYVARVARSEKDLEAFLVECARDGRQVAAMVPMPCAIVSMKVEAPTEGDQDSAADAA